MADKTKSIKNATDKELDELIIRLQKERHVQDLVADLKRRSAPNDPYGQTLPYDRPEVSTEAPIESLYHNNKEKNSLKHYGILGMKWGVRRDRQQTSSTQTTRSKAEDYVTARKLKAKGLDQLSNKELKDLTTRLQLEKQFKDLTKQELSPGRKFVADVLGNAAKETLKNVTAKYMKEGLESLLTKAAKAAAK